MSSRQELYRIAAKKALKLRREAGYSPARPCDVYELIKARDIELQFFDVPTLEGMYLEDSDIRRICVSALRPPGRQRFTAAHELGHSTLQHGTKVDSIEQLRSITRDSDLDEQVAEVFAASLMMSNSAVHAGFLLRNFDIRTPSPEQLYRVASWLGVGYSTLANHLFYAVGAISAAHHRGLLRVEPKTIKSGLAGHFTTKEVFVLDRLWCGGQVHAQVGDFFLGVVSASGDVLGKSHDNEFCALAPGESMAVLSSGGTVKVSVSRMNYVGFYDFRYLPEEK